MALAVDVVKSRGKRSVEPFDRHKLHASIYASCLTLKAPHGLADDTARSVCDVVVGWCDNKSEVTSTDIRNQAAKALEKFHPEAAHFYKHYKVIM